MLGGCFFFFDRMVTLDYTLVSMGAIDTAKELAGLVQKVGDIDLYRKIVDFQGEVVALSARNFELEKKCFELQSALDLKKRLKHDRLLYFADGDSIPFCPRCHEEDGKLLHLFGPIKMMNPKVESWQCITCFHDYNANPGEAFRASLSMRRATGIG
jgi:hypothetical protein